MQVYRKTRFMYFGEKKMYRKILILTVPIMYFTLQFCSETCYHKNDIYRFFEIQHTHLSESE